jgi:hypothetical protein
MTVRVIVPPPQLVSPEDIPGVDVGDSAVAAMIAAVTATLDGPSGWLGRSLGLQTLEISREVWCDRISLPFPPSVDIVSVKYTDDAGAEQTVDSQYYARTGDLLWFKSTWSAPSIGDFPEPIRVRYRAGYNDVEVVDGGTGPIPPQVTQAIIMSVQHLRSLAKDDLFLKVDEVDGIGRREYTVSEQAGNIIRNTAERLLQGLRIYSV